MSELGDAPRFQIVTFYLMRYLSGEIDDVTSAMRIEVKRALWLPLTEAARQMAYGNERKSCASLRNTSTRTGSTPKHGKIKLSLASMPMDARIDETKTDETRTNRHRPSIFKPRMLDRSPAFLRLSALAPQIFSILPTQRTNRNANQRKTPTPRLQESANLRSCLRPK